QKDSRVPNQHAALVYEFHELCFRQWEVSLTHVFREANYAAGYHANLGHAMCVGTDFFSFHDSMLSNWVSYDLVGVSMLRFFFLLTSSS
ncbi:hypothetical protein LINPERPRIM_LOCUS27089, partial [Linum perenne]